MEIKEAEKLAGRLRSGEKNILVMIDSVTSKYYGSIVECNLDPYYYQPNNSINYQISAPELSRRLCFFYTQLQMTSETQIKLTTVPSFKKKRIVKDFSKRVVNVDDVLFGEDKLIRIDAIRPSGLCNSTCINAVKSSSIGNKNIHRSLKKYVWIEDPIMLILSM